MLNNMKIDQIILDQQSRYYDTNFRIVSNNPRFKKVWNYIIKNNLKGNLLDIGCCNGEFCQPLIDRGGYTCYGMDSVSTELSEAQKRGVIVTHGSFLEEFPYEDNFFDIIFAGEVIEHTIDDNIFLRECSRIMKKGGTLILTTPNLVSLGNRLLMSLGFLPRFAYNEFHYRIYNLRLLKNKLKAAGFEAKKISSSHVLISTVFNKYIGMIGESLGGLFPTLGEQFIIFAKKK